MKFDINVIESATEQLKAPENAQLVLGRAVDKFVEEEREKQVDLISKAAKAINELKNELLRIKPDNEIFDENGAVVVVGYSKKNLDERNRKLGTLQKLENCLTTALEKGDYKPLKQMVSEQDKKKPEEKISE